LSLHFVDYILDMNNIYKRIAEKLGLRENAVKATAELLDEGATVPFISRYRKERTGSLDEVAVRGIESALKLVLLSALRTDLCQSIFQGRRHRLWKMLWRLPTL